MDGWIKLHRKMIKWEWFTDVNTCHLFMYCILRANHTDEKWRGIEIKRGQFITSLDKLSSATGLSVRQIRTALNKLAMTNELTSKATNKNRLISVVNYESYQEVDKQATSKRQADDKQATTNKNEKNNKKEYMFDEFYSLYPRKEARGKAEPAYKKAIKEGATHEEIIRGLKSFNEKIRKDGTERRFIALPASWLNAERWKDQYEEKPKVAISGGKSIMEEMLNVGR